MTDYGWNILVGVTDYDEGADLSTHLLSYGWNVDHGYSAEEVMDTLLDGEYGLVILDDEILSDSEWTLEELADSLPTDTHAVILGDPGSVYPLDTFGDKIRVLIRPFSYSTLHSLVEFLLSESAGTVSEDEEDNWVDEEMDLGLSFDDLEEFVAA